MNEESKKKIIKIVLISLILIFILGITLYLFPIVKNLATTEGQTEFKNMVNETGFYGLLVLFGLQIAQVIVAIIPGEPMEVLAGMCYGSLWGTVFIMLSNMLITFAIFYLVRKYGKKFIYFFFKKSSVDKILNSKIFSNPKKLEITMLILFLVPGTPKDLLIYIAGLLPINPIKFMIISNFARFPSVISSTLVGTNLALGRIKTGIIIYLVTFLFVGILLLLVNKFDKNKVIKSLKD